MAGLSPTSPDNVLEFVSVLSDEPNWFSLGICLGVPKEELSTIDRDHGSAGITKCLIKLYTYLIMEKGKLLTWDVIATALRKMENTSLAFSIQNKYIVPSAVPHVASCCSDHGSDSKRQDSVLSSPPQHGTNNDDSIKTQKLNNDPNTLEYRQLSRMAAEICQAIKNPLALAEDLHTAGFIGSALMETVRAAIDINQQLMDAVLLKIAEDSTTIYPFIDILDKNITTKELSSRIKQQCRICNYQLTRRTRHMTVLINDSVYTWGGNRYDIPFVHDSDMKRLVTSTVEVFNIPTLSWNKVKTTGVPHTGVQGYSCATNSTNDTIYFFGGNCKPYDCYHNDLLALSLDENRWTQLIADDNTVNSPMKKRGSKMVSFTGRSKKEYLLIIGGVGPTPTTVPTHSTYGPHPSIDNHSYTNEAHIICTSLKINCQWTVPLVTGTLPPPTANFSVNCIPNENSAVMFGGFVVDDSGVHRTNNVYCIAYNEECVDYKRLSFSQSNSPIGRSYHSTSLLTNNTLLILGGLDSSANVISDCWTFYISEQKWSKIDVPDYVSRRYSHSISSYTCCDNHVWLLVTGGFKEHSNFTNADVYIMDVYIACLVELVFTNGNWKASHVWNSEELIKNKESITNQILNPPTNISNSTSLLSSLQPIESGIEMNTRYMNLMHENKRLKLENEELLTTTCDLIQDLKRKRVSDNSLVSMKKYKQETDEASAEVHRMEQTYVCTEDGMSLSTEMCNTENEVSTGSMEDTNVMKKTMQTNVWQEVDRLRKTLKRKNEVIENLETQLADGKPSSNVTDSEVQFDYWVPMEDLLHGACVVDEKTFCVQGSGEQSFNWSECGFSFNVPEGALLGTETCDVAVKALIAGYFKFPSNTQLISGLYAVSASREFRKPVRTIIQHCLKVKRKSQISRMKFIKAHQTQKGMPYIFSIEEGGKFEIDSQYGSFWQTSFSDTGIILENQPQVHPTVVPTVDHGTDVGSNTNEQEADEFDNEQAVSNETEDTADGGRESLSLPSVLNDDDQLNENDSEASKQIQNKSDIQTADHCEDILNYCALTFYEWKASHRYIHKFVAIMGLQTHIQYVTTSRSFSSLEQGERLFFSFLDSSPESRITLNFPHDDIDCNGWKIQPYFSPSFITKRTIDILMGKESQIQGQGINPTIPVCLTDVYMYADPGIAANLRYPVSISGIEPSVTMYIQRYKDVDQLQGQKATIPSSIQPTEQAALVEKDQTAYLEVVKRHFNALSSMVTQPLTTRLANSLTVAGFISQEIADNVANVRAGISDLEISTNLFREVRNMFILWEKDPIIVQREKMTKFCNVLDAQGSPVLSHITRQIREESDIAD